MQRGKRVPGSRSAEGRKSLWVKKFLSKSKKLYMKPFLSRVKCVCLQNLNKILCVPYNKSYSDTFRQSVQKDFSFFVSNLLENYSKI